MDNHRSVVRLPDQGRPSTGHTAAHGKGCLSPLPNFDGQLTEWMGQGGTQAAKALTKANIVGSASVSTELTEAIISTWECPPSTATALPLRPMTLALRPLHDCMREAEWKPLCILGRQQEGSSLKQRQQQRLRWILPEPSRAAPPPTRMAGA